MNSFILNNSIGLIQVSMARHRAQADHITSDNLIVLGFSNLQLKRVGALQDKLIELSLAGARQGEALGEQFNEEQTERVNETLREYGG